MKQAKNVKKLGKQNYEDGGIVAKKKALVNLKNAMSAMGGNSLTESLASTSESNFQDGGVVKASASDITEDVIEAKDEQESNLDDLSREELIQLLKNK